MGKKGKKGNDKKGNGLTVHVDNCQISTANNHALAHDKTKTTSTTSNYTNLALEGERSKGSLHVEATTALDGRRGRKGVLLRILYGDTVVRTSKGTGRGWRLLVLVVLVVQRVIVVVQVSGGAG